LARFVQNNNAQNVPSPSGADLKVKPMLAGRAYARAKYIKTVSLLQAEICVY